MPSLRTLFVAFGLAVSSTHALAIPGQDCEGGYPSPTPTLPVTGGATELPTTNLTLSYVAIGRGVQNYTCAAPSAIPVAIGAVATLFDATGLAHANEALLNTIPPLAVYEPVPKYVLGVAGHYFGILGHHYFDAKLTPTFDLSTVGKVLFGAKTADVKAPSTANKGPAGTGAVDWLQLKQKANYTSVGLSAVYRVVTAGGAAPALCADSKPISVEYSAEYWFFD